MKNKSGQHLSTSTTFEPTTTMESRKILWGIFGIYLLILAKVAIVNGDAVETSTDTLVSANDIVTEGRLETEPHTTTTATDCVCNCDNLENVVDCVTEAQQDSQTENIRGEANEDSTTDSELKNGLQNIPATTNRNDESVTDSGATIVDDEKNTVATAPITNVPNVESESSTGIPNTPVDAVATNIPPAPNTPVDSATNTPSSPNIPVDSATNIPPAPNTPVDSATNTPSSPNISVDSATNIPPAPNTPVDSATNIPASPNSSVDSATLLPPPPPCATPGLQPHDTDCHAFYDCSSAESSDGSLRLLTKFCASNQAFSVEFSACSRDISPCANDVVCLAKGGVADPSSNNSYYLCEPRLIGGGFHVFHVQCSDNQLFFPALGKCFLDFNNLGQQPFPAFPPYNWNQIEDIDLVKAEMKIIKEHDKLKLKVEKEKLKAEQKLQKEIEKETARIAKEQEKFLEKQIKLEGDQFVCLQEGSFPSTLSDTVYYTCVAKKTKYKKVLMKCPLGSKFNAESGTCLTDGNPQNIVETDDDEDDDDNDD